jgi:hypothetical protein
MNLRHVMYTATVGTTTVPPQFNFTQRESQILTVTGSRRLVQRNCELGRGGLLGWSEDMLPSHLARGEGVCLSENECTSIVSMELHLYPYQKYIDV